MLFRSLRDQVVIGYFRTPTLRDYVVIGCFSILTLHD